MSHCSNRSPYPILHLLREDDISRAVEALDDPEAIYQRNIATLRRLEGLPEWDGSGPDTPGGLGVDVDGFLARLDTVPGA